MVRVYQEKRKGRRSPVGTKKGKSANVILWTIPSRGGSITPKKLEGGEEGGGLWRTFPENCMYNSGKRGGVLKIRGKKGFCATKTVRGNHFIGKRYHFYKINAGLTLKLQGKR